jgi:Arc/MetJ-type ribon-helix-helix transcriptional regulator
MQYSFPSDLQKLIAAGLVTGRYKTEDDLLRDAFRALAEEDEDLLAVRDALGE